MRRRISPVNLDTISSEWDIMGPLRHVLIETGKDYTLEHITGPCIIDNLKMIRHERIIDVGCGTGFLTNKMSKMATECCGIDYSRASIKVAIQKYARDNLHFFCSSIKDYSSDQLFDVCIANMVFMDDPEWQDSLRNIATLLFPNGKLLMTITHPCFWPRYWEYQDKEWFNYMEEVFVQGTFSMTLVKDMGTTTHIHRPLSSYFSSIIDSGFDIEKVLELQAPMNAIGSDDSSFPRYLFIQAGKTAN